MIYFDKREDKKGSMPPVFHKICFEAFRVLSAVWVVSGFLPPSPEKNLLPLEKFLWMPMNRIFLSYLERSFWRSRFVENLEIDSDHVLSDSILGQDCVRTLKEKQTCLCNILYVFPSKQWVALHSNALIKCKLIPYYH